MAFTPRRSVPPSNPAANPYSKGIYAEGIVESYQNNGANINLYPEVSGTIVEIPVHEGQRVAKGTILMRLDDSVQRASAEQQQSQAEAARTLLDELKAHPRKETFEVSKAQVAYARPAQERRRRVGQAASVLSIEPQVG